jgi:hypothetical protein
MGRAVAISNLYVEENRIYWLTAGVVTGLPESDRFLAEVHNLYSVVSNSANSD